MKKVAYIFLSLFLFASCLNDSYYDIDYPTESVLKSPADLDKMIKGVYRRLYSEPWSGNIANDMFHSRTGDDVRGVDNAIAIQGDAAYYWLWKEFDVYRESEQFRYAYASIALCNEVIDFIDAAYDKNELPFEQLSTQSAEVIKKNCDRIKGEMHFLRALIYHLLARTFCPPYIKPGHSNNDTRLLPYKVHFDRNVEGNKNPKIASVQEIFDLIVSDLRIAKSYLPMSYDPAIHDVSYKEGRPTHWSASALLARIYFQRREWTDCEKECTYVIENGPFTLEGTQPIDAWNKNMGEGTSPEVIFEFATSREQGGRPATWINMTKNHYNAKNGGRYIGDDGSSYNKSQWTHVVWSYYGLEYVGWWDIEKHWDENRGTDIVDIYTELPEARKDLRYSQLNYRMEADPTPEQLEGLTNEEIEKKYPKHTYMKVWNFPNPYLYCDKYYRATDGELSKYPYIRLPELLLDRAIIKQKFNIGNSSPLDDVNKIRIRAGVDPLTSINEEDIHKERMKELFMEVGDRRFYLQALDMPVGIGDRNPNLYKPIESPYSSTHVPLPVNEINNNDSYEGMELPNQFNN